MAKGAPTTSLVIFLSLKDLEPRKTSWTGPKGPAPPTWIRATLGPPTLTSFAAWWAPSTGHVVECPEQPPSPPPKW